MFCCGPNARKQGQGPIHLSDDTDTFDVEKLSLAPDGLEEKSKTQATEDELLTRLHDLKLEINGTKLDWYVIPSEDEHQSEEVGETEKRREYISGFTGSAGTAIIPSSSSSDLTSRPALLFVDSRYWIQAEQQVPEGWEVRRVGATGGGSGSGKDDVVGGWIDWVVREVANGSRIGIDSKLISLDLARSIGSRLESSSSTQLVPIADNLVDKIRTVPARSLGPLLPYPLSLSGEDTPSKLAKIRYSFSDHISSFDDSQDWIYILPTLPAIAWLLNFRCPTDIPFCPVAYAYLLLTPSKCVIFVDERKIIDEELKSRFKDEGIEIRPYGVDQVGGYIKDLVGMSEKKERKVRVFAPKECSWALGKACNPAEIQIIPCPVETAKGIKNSIEQQGFRNAYLRDGRAMVRWMAWLEKTILKEERKVGEWAAAQTLTRYRRKEELFAGLAYDDISGSGPHGALPHYAPQRGKDSLIDIDSTYVIDSGAQYQDGTIDTTRTLYLGKAPSPEVKRAYTRVLQGHMAVSTAVFPKGMPGDRLVMLAKAPLYDDGLDFGHGIGHGVGTYLAVHESPGYSKPMQPGQVVTIEPGYYKEGEWGIRIESLLLCKEVGGDGPTCEFLTFERITQVPIQTSLVDYSLLSKSEIRWLNEHNTDVKEILMPLLEADEDADARDWLNRMTKPHKIWPWTGRE